MDIVGAIKSVADAFKGVFDWATGGRSRDENKLRAEAEHWQEEYDHAMRIRDPYLASVALAELRKLRDEARSKAR